MTGNEPQQSGLWVEGLYKSFGGVEATRNVSFHVPVGGMVAMIGPNGAGKTTCFHLLNGQLRADRGSVHLDGRQISGLAPRKIWRYGVARTFQIASIFRSMVVWENVAMVLLSLDRSFESFRPSRLAGCRGRALELLARVGIADQGDRRTASLSYGDVKRVELAVALASRPRLLLMDEPTAGMAPSERGTLMALVRALALETGMSVLFTEHDMDVVFGHADHVLVLVRGALIAEGTPEKVRANPEVREVYLGGEA